MTVKLDDIQVVGQKIVEFRNATEVERKLQGFDYHSNVPIFILDNGVKLIPSADYEGNGPGAIFAEKNKQAFTIMPK
tara:strand:- start:1114 stop:1344 length:231 start_codon:yes stop_codon:yes gene_type:complete